jgi:raffinose/stachyose/melibiose transport system substrate-binding protein
MDGQVIGLARTDACDHSNVSFRKWSRRRWLRALGLAAALSAPLAAAIGAFGVSPAAADPVTIRLLDRATDPKQTGYVSWLVDSFNKAHEGSIKVTVDTIPDDDFHQKISLVMNGANAPDVFFSWEGGWAELMVSSGFAAPLDAYYQKYGWDKELTPAATKLATFQDHQWFLPYYMSASVVWYNTDLFKKYDLTPPKTWEELQHVVDVLKQNNVAPFLLANQQQWEAQFDWTAYFVNKNGADAYQDLLTRKIAWTDPRVVDAFAQMKRMVDDGWFLSGVNSMDFDGTAIIFWKRQQAAMWYQGSFILSRFLGEDGKLEYPVDWFPYPKIGDTDPSVSIFAESTWMINKNSQHKDEAAELLNYLVSKEAQSKMVTDLGPFPANISVDESKLPPMVKRLGDLISNYGGYTWMHVDHALGPGVAQPFLEELQGLLAGTVTPEDAAATTEKAALATQGPVTK